MATQGLIPYCNIYSTFLQRAYDQVIHDVALQNIPVIFCLDRAGLVGEDGATHHGVFDIAYLRCIPNLIVAAPRDAIGLRNLLYTVQFGLKAPIAIRYPRGKGTVINWRLPFKKLDIGKSIGLTKGSTIAILSLGPIGSNVDQALERLKHPKEISHYDMLFVKPLDTVLLHNVFQNHKAVLTIEDGVVTGGFGSAILEFSNEHHYSIPIKRLGVPDRFIDHGKVEELRDIAGISSEKITLEIEKLLNQFHH